MHAHQRLLTTFHYCHLQASLLPVRRVRRMLPDYLTFTFLTVPSENFRMFIPFTGALMRWPPVV